MERTVTSASNMHRRFGCLGSENMERDLPDADSEDAALGTEFHRLYANPSLDRSNLESDSLEALEAAERMTADFALWLAREWPGVTFEIKREIELPLRLAGGGLIKNHADVLMLSHSPPVIAVVDAKFGRRGAPPAADNHQIHTYLTSLTQNFLHARAADSGSFVGVIIAPWQSKTIAPVVMRWDDLIQYYEKLSDNANKASDPHAPRTASLDNCRYCRGKLNGVCPEAHAFALEPIKKFQMNQTLALATKTPLELMQSLTAEKRTQLLDAFEMAQDLRDIVRDGARQLLAKDPAAIPGYHVGKPGTKETIVDLGTLRGRVLPLGVSDTVFASACSMTKKNFATLVKEATQLKGKALDEEQAKLLKGVVDITPTEGKLTRE